MSSLIPANGHVAVFARTRRDGTEYAYRTPVIAWNEDGRAYVHDDNWGGLAHAGELKGYLKTESARPPVVSAIPAQGWTAEFTASETATTFRPVVAWAIRADGDAFPVAMDTSGEAFNAVEDPDFLRLVGPGVAQ